MNPRQTRRERREAERKAKKLELKSIRQGGANPLADGAPSSCAPIGFESQNTVPATSRAQTNRANAQHSTGPTSAAGKLASSRNATKHGLASGQLLIPGEDPAAFESLLHDLLQEHAPANPTEHLLVTQLAQSYWLAQRAIRLQNTCFTAEGVDQKQLALLLRYGTTHQRNFDKALNTLIRLKKETAKVQIGFVSQRAKPQTGFTSEFASGFASSGFVSQTPPQPPHNPRAPSIAAFDRP